MGILVYLRKKTEGEKRMLLVISRSTGGFDLSTEGFKYLIKLGWSVGPLPEDDEDFDSINYRIFDIDGEYDFAEPNLKAIFLRSHPDLVKVVRDLGSVANGEGSNLHIVEVPDDIDPEIIEVNGLEWVVDRKSIWPDTGDLQEQCDVPTEMV